MSYSMYAVAGTAATPGRCRSARPRKQPHGERHEKEESGLAEGPPGELAPVGHRAPAPGCGLRTLLPSLPTKRTCVHHPHLPGVLIRCLIEVLAVARACTAGSGFCECAVEWANVLVGQADGSALLAGAMRGPRQDQVTEAPSGNCDNAGNLMCFRTWMRRSSRCRACPAGGLAEDLSPLEGQQRQRGQAALRLLRQLDRQAAERQRKVI